MAQYGVELDRLKAQGSKVSNSFSDKGLRNNQMLSLEDNIIIGFPKYDVVKQEIAGSFKVVNGKKVPVTWEFLLAENQNDSSKLHQFGPGALTRSRLSVTVEEVVDDEGNTSEEIIPGNMKYSTGGVVDHVVGNCTTEEAAMRYLYECSKHGYFVHVKVDPVTTFKFGSTTEVKEDKVYKLNWVKDGKTITDPKKYPPLTWEEEAPAAAAAAPEA